MALPISPLSIVYLLDPIPLVSRFPLSQLVGYPVKAEIWERRKRAGIATVVVFYSNKLDFWTFLFHRTALELDCGTACLSGCS